MHLLKLLLLFFLFFLYNVKAENQKKIEYSYINIDANVKDTTVLLDELEIGKTPIKNYRVEANKPLNLTALADTNYYEKDLTKTLTLMPNTQKTHTFHFKKSKAKLFFIGDNVHLYINDKFIRALNEHNRVIKIEAGKNVEIYLEDGYKSIKFKKDIKASENIQEIPYQFELNKDIKLYTSTVENLMWEDTKDAASKKLNWEKANTYCKDLTLGDFTDWKLPSLEQLKQLEEYHKDKIYNGYGKTFYWSSDISLSKDQIWGYSASRDFENKKTTNPVKVVENGYVRCVRELYPKQNISSPQETDTKIDSQMKLEEEKIQEKLTKEKNIKELGYDPDLTKDLEKYMLK